MYILCFFFIGQCHFSMLCNPPLVAVDFKMEVLSALIIVPLTFGRNPNVL